MINELEQHIHPKLQLIGALHYFDERARPAGKAIGLDMFRLYVAGRGGVMGDVDAPVVQAAFGYFSPGLIAKMWDSSRERSSVREAAKVHMDVAREIGRDRLAGVDGMAETASALRAISQSVDASGLPLFAGFQSLDAVDDGPGAFMQETIVMRELRGSVHLAAIASSGCRPVVAHAIRRPNDVEGFGWAEAPTVTDEDREALAQADLRTDEVMGGLFAALPDGTTDTVRSTVDAAYASLTR